MISKYLKELIDSNNRIIIPDFGAFMIQDSPDGKQISFNDFLKFNDGLLINQIIKTEKISKIQAADQIKEFVKEVEKSFLQKKPYEIKGVGFLSKDNHNSIKFETKAKTEPAATAATSPTDVKPTIVLDEKTEKTKAKTDKKTVAQPVKEEKKSTPPVAPTTKTAQPKTEASKVEAPKATPPKTVPPKAPEKKTIPTTTNTKTAYKKPTTTSTQSSDNNTTKILIIIAAAVIILGGGTWAFFKFDLISLFSKTEAPAPVVEPVVVIDTVAAVDTVAVDTVEQPIVIEEPVEDTRTKYYLIGGSFKVVSNAENFNQKLINEGYNSEIIVRNNGFNCVSYKVFYEWNDIVNEWRQMKNTNPQIWILIK